jgi:UDP-glucose 4-epimerase
MRVLVTGGAGFIGSHLSRRLVARGDLVLALDDLSTGRRENVVDLPHARFALVQDSILNAEALEWEMRHADAVVHLAAVVGVKRVLESSLSTLRTNVVGTQVVLETAVRAGPRGPVLLASTSEVYGMSDLLPFREDGPTAHHEQTGPERHRCAPR